LYPRTLSISARSGSLVLIIMKKHDPRCEGTDDEKVIADIAEYGWHVVNIFETDETPGWAFSIGLYRNFDHPEILVFGLKVGLMHSIINNIGDGVCSGKTYQVDGEYEELINSYSCAFKSVNPVWYYHFLGYANWFYKNQKYLVLQCFWPDRDSRYPWDPEFNPKLLWAQPLLFHKDPESARTIELLKSMGPE
jgi:Domain of unknown function (DUF4262)